MYKQELQAYCRRDAALYADVEQAYHRGLAENMYVGEDGFMQFTPQSGLLSIDAKDAAAVQRLLAMLPQGLQIDLVTAYAAWQLPLLQAKFDMHDVSEPCYGCAYLASTPPAVTTDAQIRTLDASFAPIVLDKYHMVSADDAGDVEYITAMLQSGAMLGAFVQGELAGFIGQHGEGSMGMLEVFAPYRHCGLALALEGEKIKRTLEMGWVPFCDVFESNGASLALQKKLGLTIGDGRRWWMS